MQQAQHHDNPVNWEAACMSLVDKDLPTLVTDSPKPNQTLHDTGAQAAVEAQPSIAIESPPAPVQAPVVAEPPLDLNSIFAGYRKLGTEIDALIEKQRAIECALFGDSFTAQVRLEDIEKIAKSAIESLISQAEKNYAPPGGKLSISRNEVMETLKLDDWAYSRRRWREDDDKDVEQIVDLVKIEQHLEATYGGDAGIRRGLSQAAAELIKQFNLKDEESVVRTKSGAVLSTRVFSTKKDYGHDKGKYETYHSAHERRFPLFQALETFFKHAELYQLYNYGLSRSELVSYGFCFTPREKYIAPGLEISFFKEEWKFKFAPAEAEKLMLFLGEFGQEE